MREKPSQWATNDEGLITIQGKVYVLADDDLRRCIVKERHGSKAAGHPGQYKTLELVQRDFWWNRMGEFIQDYITGCAVCQSTKNNTHPTCVPLQPMTTNEVCQPFEVVTMDYITGLPKSKGYDSIYVVVDHGCSKAAVIVPCHSTITAEGTAKLYQNHVWKRFGLPRKQISDRGPQFVARFTEELCKRLAIERALSTAFHPQTDGQTEWVNQELEQYLRAFCSHRQDNWAELLPLAEFAHNIREHSTTKQSPFKVLMGYEPRTFSDVGATSRVEEVRKRLGRLAEIREEAHASHKVAAELIWWRDKNPMTNFEVEQEVWLEGDKLHTTHPTAKLALKRHGPFTITQKVGNVNYWLKLPPQWQIHNLFHASKITPYKETEAYSPNYAKPPPDLVDGEQQYEVEAVVQSKVDKGLLYYLVKWARWPGSDNTWQRPHDLENAREALIKFHEEYPDAPDRDTRKNIKARWIALEALHLE